MLTNCPAIVHQELLAQNVDSSNTTVKALQLTDLRYCSGHDGETFEFAFSKLDALMTVISKVLTGKPNLKLSVCSTVQLARDWLRHTWVPSWKQH
jgi:hypothetical protein